MTRLPFDPADPWAIPAAAASATLVRSSDGTPPRLPTRLGLFHHEQRLHVVFSCADDGVVASHTERDAPLWEEDVVEVFLAPAHLREYFELEVSPRGVVFDARIRSPHLARETMEVDPAWDCADLYTAVRRTETSLDVVVAIPFASLGRAEPRRNERWQANFYRIDRSPLGDEFTAWSPTGRTPPDFHVPERFGELVFA